MDFRKSRFVSVMKFLLPGTALGLLLLIAAWPSLRQTDEPVRLSAPTRAVNPEMGITVLAESFVVTVVGGMGSLPGAVVAGLLVGVVFSLTSLIAPDLAELSIFVLMALVLLVRPQGFFGKAGLMS